MFIIMFEIQQISFK